MNASHHIGQREKRDEAGPQRRLLRARPLRILALAALLLAGGVLMLALAIYQAGSQ